MTVETVSSILGIGANAILYHISQGNLAAAKYGRAYDIEPVALVDFYQSHWAQGTDMSKFLANVCPDNSDTSEAIRAMQKVLSTQKNPSNAGG